jgi:hypothetical protein
MACVFGGSTIALGQVTTLHSAAATGNAAQLKKHIEKKADVNAADENGNMPLKLAVESGSVECVNMLLQAGANPNAKDSSGSTALMAACQAGFKEIEEALLAAKADPAVKNATGMTALHIAAMMRQLDVIEPLIKAHADVNAKDNDGQTPVVLAQRSGATEIVELLRQNGATMPVVQDPMAMYGNPSQGAAPVVAASRRPDNFVIDANAIARQLLEAPTLLPPLKVIDANSLSEQRAWIGRRSDNRTTLLRTVQKQFEDEMSFVKKVAVEEKAVKTTKAVDDLVTARKKRYERIGQDLRDQIRQNRNESRDTGTTTATTGRGGRGNSGGGRSMRGRGANAGGGTGQDVYGTANQARASRRTVAEPNQAPVDAETQAQIQAWTSASAEDKSALLLATSDLDVTEYAVLAKSAEEEKAAKTQLAVMALLMQREQRLATIRQRWVEDDARTQRLQERGGANGMQGTQPGTGQGTQRGMRRGGR